ncbi:MAG: O-antigen ligase family protein [Elusimicrobia bacterium]|nr:O-antigen ligase family protein [Elusimicrobiota bacterium]
MILRRLAVLLFFFVALFSPFLNASWDIWSQTLIHLLTLLILTLFLFQDLPQEGKITLYYTTADLWFLLYLAAGVVSYSWSINQFNTRNEIYNHFNYYLLFYLGPLLLSEDFRQALFCRILGSVAGISALIIVWQAWSGQQITGYLLNANVASGFFIMVIPVLISRLAVANIQKKALISSLPEIVLIVIILSGLWVNRSLGAWLSLFLGMTLFMILSSKKIVENNIILPKCIFLGILIGAVVLSYFLMIKIHEPEVYNRLWWWKGAVSMIRDHPLGGVGLGNFGAMYLVYKTAGLNSLYAHNHYLQLWSEIGIFGLFFWLVGVYKVVSGNLSNLAKQEPQRQFISLGLISATCGLLLNSLLDYSLAIPAIAIIWWVLLGLLRFSLPTQFFSLKISLASRVVYLIAAIIMGVVITKPFLASQRYVSGLDYLNGKNTSAAKKMMQDSIVLDPLNAQAYGFLSDIAKKEGDLNTAIAYLQKAISLNEYFGPFHHNLALLYEAQGNLPQAIIEAERALACHRQKALYHYTLSLFYKKVGRLTEAEQEYRQCQELLPLAQNN